jgi:hypothetical protein
MQSMTPPAAEPSPQREPKHPLVLALGAAVLLLLAWELLGSLIKHGLGPALLATISSAVAVVLLWWRVISPAFSQHYLRHDRDRIHARLQEELADTAPELREQTRREVLAAERDIALGQARELARSPTLAVSAILSDRLQSAFIAFIVAGVLLSPMLLILGPYSIGIFIMLLSVIALCILCVFGVGAGAVVMKQHAQQRDVLRVTRHIATIDELAGALSLAEPTTGAGELEVAAQHGEVELVEREAPQRH